MWSAKIDFATTRWRDGHCAADARFGADVASGRSVVLPRPGRHVSGASYHSSEPSARTLGG